MTVFDGAQHGEVRTVVHSTLNRSDAMSMARELWPFPFESPNKWPFGAGTVYATVEFDAISSSAAIELEYERKRYNSDERLEVYCVCGPYKHRDESLAHFRENGVAVAPDDFADSDIVPFLQAVELGHGLWWQPPNPRSLRVVDWRCPIRLLQLNVKRQIKLELDVVAARLGEPSYFAALSPSIFLARTLG